MRLLLVLAIGTLPVIVLGQSQPRPYSVPAPDAPELAPRGRYSVGVRTLDLVNSNQIDVLHFDKDSGKAPRYDRPLRVEIWYPATIPAGQVERTTYQMPVPADPGMATNQFFEVPDRALRDAAPVNETAFPLVVISHGYPGSRYFLSYLGSNLASKGYVIAAIDHTDSVFGNAKGFQSTLLNRSADQLFTIHAIAAFSRQSSNFLYRLVDPGNVALIGYSMGGYGALISAGAGLNGSNPMMNFVPGGYLKEWTDDNPAFQAIDRKSVKAIVAIAPWGEEPPQTLWQPRGVAAIHVPSLFIAGDHDDIAGFAQGVHRIFELAVHSDRCLLVYENARHNTGGDPAPANADLDYKLIQAFDEPVWRKGRINEINQHFITAFLDLYLKSDQSRAAYLHVLPAHSNDGRWPASQPGGDQGPYRAESGPDTLFWKGFQKRWALGLEMECHDAVEGAATNR